MSNKLVGCCGWYHRFNPACLLRQRDERCVQVLLHRVSFKQVRGHPEHLESDCDCVSCSKEGGGFRGKLGRCNCVSFLQGTMMILRKIRLRIFLQRFWGRWFLFAKMLRKMPLDNLDSSILWARGNHPVVVRRKCKISHLTVSFWSQKMTKYILPTQILVHRVVFNWSYLRFLNAPPRFI